jgi:hypothetical protein
MKKIDIIKKSVQFIVHAGVTKIVHDIIANNVDVEKTRHKVVVPVASFAIGGAVADAASAHTDALIDQLAVAWNQIKPKADEK